MTAISVPGGCHVDGWTLAGCAGGNGSADGSGDQIATGTETGKRGRGSHAIAVFQMGAAHFLHLL